MGLRSSLQAAHAVMMSRGSASVDRAGVNGNPNSHKGLDNSAEMLGIARRGVPALHFDVRSLLNLPTADAA